MKLGRFLHGEEEVYGSVEGERVRIAKSFGELNESTELLELRELKFLTPSEPSKIVCVGLNYADHAKELKMELPKEPIIFLKPPSATLAHEGSVVYPQTSRQLDYEAELSVVIEKRCKNVARENAFDAVLGYTCFNDFTARDLQKRDSQWTRSKSFDTLAPFGPWIVTRDEIENPHDLNVALRVNGVVKQNSGTRNLIFGIDLLIEFISQIMTLEAGDVIATGTPQGVGAVNRGDIVEIEIEKIGVLRNRIV